MYPQNFEIEEVGNAFITLCMPEYSEAQQDYLNEILSRYAHDYNPEQVKSVFNDKIAVADAMKVLHEFAEQYQNEEEIYVEFKNEVEELLDTINNCRGKVST